ncbi:hypothetical protein TTY48_28840 [Tsukamurella sp. TY48]|nr:hypothetical protein TTY48_28840 [Tsukamurella sp. TY48]
MAVEDHGDEAVATGAAGGALAELGADGSGELVGVRHDAPNVRCGLGDPRRPALARTGGARGVERKFASITAAGAALAEKVVAQLTESAGRQ